MSTVAAPPAPRFVCSKCGGPSVSIDQSKTAMDPRYPIGHCDRCTPIPKARLRPGADKKSPKPTDWYTPARRTVALIRADLDDPGDRAHRAKVEEARRLAKKLHDPKANAKMSKAELQQASDAVLWLRRGE